MLENYQHNEHKFSEIMQRNFQQLSADCVKNELFKLPV
jgi:hypothetical protein